VGLAILLTVTRGDHTPGLTLPVREVTIVVNDDVACLSSGLRSHNALCGHYFSSEGGFVLVHIHRNSGLVIVRRGLKEVLFGTQASAESRATSRNKSRGGCNTGGNTKSCLDHLD
jgi:hypothetical protein